MPEMTSRELVRRTLAHQNTPRAPRNLWVLPWAERRYPGELAALRAEFPDDFDYIGVDYPKLPCMCGDPYAIGTCTDEWNCTFVNLQEGVIGEVKNPIVQEYDRDLPLVRPPNEWIEADLSGVKARCAATDKFTVAGVCVRLFERMQFLRGTENLYMDLATRPEGLLELRDIVHRWNLAMIDRWAATEVDAVSWMDDWGSQRGLLMNPTTWRELFKPCYAEYCRRIHDAGKACLVHSDGHIMAVYEDCIEIGIDAINSQLFCMDIEEIGRRYKGRITFWGEIDRQHLLPNGSVDEISAAVERVAAAIYDGHGGAIAQCEFGAGARPENVREVFAAWERISRTR